MSLLSSLGPQVDSTARSDGDACHEAGRVRLLFGDDELVTALVLGDRDDEVALARAPGGLRATCTCPGAEESTTVCKHIWAVLRAAEEAGHLAPAGQPLPKTIAFDVALREEAFPPPPEPDGKGGEATRPAPVGPRRRPGRPSLDWRGITEPLWRSERHAPRAISPERPFRVMHVIEPSTSRDHGTLVIRLGRVDAGPLGDRIPIRPLRLPNDQVASLDAAIDREVLEMLRGARPAISLLDEEMLAEALVPDLWEIPLPLARLLLPLLSLHARLAMHNESGAGEARPLRWAGDEPWRFILTVHAEESSNVYQLGGRFQRGDRTLALREPDLVLRGGLLLIGGTIAPLIDPGAFEWIELLSRSGSIFVPLSEGEELLSRLLSASVPLTMELPEELQCQTVSLRPCPLLRVEAGGRVLKSDAERLRAHLYFDYEGTRVHAGIASESIPQVPRRRVVIRDVEVELEAAARLEALGFKRRPARSDEPKLFHLPVRNFAEAVSALIAEGWRVEASGRTYRPASSLSLHVGSGVDWFDLSGSAHFGDQEVPLPELLKALARKERFVLLGDGGMGVLPEEWLRRFGRLAGLSEPVEGALRFSRSQAGLLDALLALEPEATCDEAFAKLRERLAHFEGVEPGVEPAGFKGTLRDYQREGLGWFAFLREFGFGGCLADDMGLGKTVQVLALLAARRALGAGPSLVVAPRSLVFNWKEEANRFVPDLRVLDHTGALRRGDPAEFSSCDLVLTTYGTLRRDAAAMSRMKFDYVVLDEAQAIKNAGTQAAKAARLLKSHHRLALSGTPVENHLGELWSLFEFLNPGMLGKASVFASLAEMAPPGVLSDGGDAGEADGGRARSEVPASEGHALVARALRPFILRRTKGQVARELPPRTETTLSCELDEGERRLYDEMRDHYRASLSSTIASVGMQRSTIHVLEALLRLRQAACHPGLVDPSRTGESSAKLEVLISRLAEVLDEGHKALVFSQFTALLAIVRRRLDEMKLPYAYLDGKTRDRAGQVNRFQTDPDCRIFLISLKAGGLGLNLTAAEYVFLLDPWWNPAAEAQAIDRAHRIGQTRRVVACRLVARETVEEKILQLQKSKRDLADAIIQADSGPLGALSRDDLELLLS